MESTIWDSIAATSWWVYFFYAFLLRSGYLATKPRQGAYKSIRNTAILFFFFATGTLVALKLFSLMTFGYWLGALTIGILTGWLQYRLARIKVIPETKIVQLAGSWFPMLIVFGLIYLYSRYGMNYAINLDLIHNPTVLAWLPAFYGLFAGLMIGKVLYLRQALNTPARQYEQAHTPPALPGHSHPPASTQYAPDNAS